VAKGTFDDLLPPLTAEELVLMDDDLSKIAELSGRGEVLAISGGPVMVWWGVLMPLTSLAFILRYIDILPSWLPIVPIQTIVGYGGTLTIMWLRGRNVKFNAWQSQAVLTIWVFAGATIFIFNLGCAMTRFNNMMLITAFMCFILGLAVAVMGAAGRRRMLLIPATGWTITGFVMFFLDDVILRQGALGAAAVLFFLVPGLMLTFKGKARDTQAV